MAAAALPMLDEDVATANIFRYGNGRRSGEDEVLKENRHPGMEVITLM